MNQVVTARLIALTIMNLNAVALAVQPPQNISPVGITVLSGTFSPSQPSTLEAAINRSGLAVEDFATTDLATVLNDPSDVNEARLFYADPASVRLDLGGDHTVATAYLWNSDSIANNNIGTYAYTFRDSALNILGTSGELLATDVEYLQQLPPDVFTLDNPLASVRYVDLSMTIREASGNGIYGLSEVAFYVVPEPTTFTLLGLGSLAFVLMRKQRTI